MPGNWHSYRNLIFFPIKAISTQTSPKVPDGELHKVYNIRGKGIQGVFDYEDFKKMMIEIGAVGRVTGETDRYIVGLFEYACPHRLITSTHDELCLHPVFIEVFVAVKPDPGKGARTVYPYGSDIDEEEYRDIR